MSPATKAILFGGCLAAALDIVYAFILGASFGRSVQWVLQSVASGWLGKAAFQGGWPTALLGLASHFAILIVAAALYYTASRRFAFLATQAVACGALFGVGVYLFMNFVVVPLSAFPFTLRHPPLTLLQGFASHALLVGIPIALFIRRAGARPPRSTA